MRRILILLVAVTAVLSCYDLKAQGLVYEPFVPRQSTGGYDSGFPTTGNGSARTRTAAERVRTNAYFLFRNGDVGKLRIEVEIYSGSAQVVGYYEAPQAMVYNATGRWLQLQPQAMVKKCYPDLAGDPLEREFMYKALIRGTYYYFDL